MTEPVGRGSLTGRWEPRPGACPNIRGGITIDRDLPAKTKLWLTGWTKTVARRRGCVGTGGDRRRRREVKPVIRSATPPAERMRQYRRRRRWKRLLVRVELDATEIGVLVSRGYLNPREKENLEAIQQAANDFISDATLL